MLELICIAIAVYYESRSEPYEGQRAVASVIVNRTADPRWPSHACAVITQKGQFEFYPPSKPMKDKKAFRTALAVSSHALKETNTRAVFYAHPGLLKRKKILEIGRHEFYE